MEATEPVDGWFEGREVVGEPSLPNGLSRIPPRDVGDEPGSATAGLGGMSRLEVGAPPLEEDPRSRRPRSMLEGVDGWTIPRWLCTSHRLAAALSFSDSGYAS